MFGASLFEAVAFFRSTIKFAALPHRVADHYVVTLRGRVAFPDWFCLALSDVAFRIDALVSCDYRVRTRVFMERVRCVRIYDVGAR